MNLFEALKNVKSTLQNVHDIHNVRKNGVNVKEMLTVNSVILIFTISESFCMMDRT